MAGNKLAFATLAGAVTSFILGYALYGVLLVGFFAANGGSATGVMKEPVNLVAIGLGQIPFALLMALIISRWGNAKSIAGGAKVGAMIGFLMALGMDVTMYGSSNLSNLTATLVDPFVSLLLSAITGAVIGLVLSKGSDAAAA